MKTKRFVKIATLVLATMLLIGAAIGIGISAEEIGATEVSVAGKNVVYQGELRIAYYVDAPDFDPETQNLKMNFWIGSKSGSAHYIAEFQGDSDIITKDGKTYYTIFSMGIQPVDMTVPLYCQPFVENEDGSIVAAEEITEYSVYTYAMNRFSQTPTQDQLTLYKALLDYGAAVQSVFDNANVATYGWADAYYDITKYVFVDDVLNAEKSLTRGTPYRPSEIEVTEKGHLLGLANSTLDGAYFKNITDEDGVPVDVQYALPGTYTYNVNYTTAGVLSDFNSATDVNTLFIPTSGVNQYKAWWSGYLGSLNAKSETGTYMLFENGYLASGTDGAKNNYGGWQIDINNGTNLPVTAGVTYVVAFDFKIADMVEVAGNDGHLGWFGVSYTQNGYWSAQSDADQGTKAYIASIDPYVVSGKTYMGESSNVVPNGEWFNLRTEVEIVSVDNTATSENEAKSIVRIYTDGVLALTYEVNMAKSPESLHFWFRDSVAKVEYQLDNLYVNSYAPSNTKGAGAYNNGSASSAANKVDADGVADLNAVLSANGFEVNNKKSDNALFVNEKGEIVAKTAGQAASIVIAGPDNTNNDGERGVKYVAELDIKVTATNAAAGEVVGTLAIYADAAGQNKLASVDIVKNADGTASIGNKVLNPNKWYNIRLEYKIEANGFKIDNAVSFDGTLNVYVFTDLAYTTKIEGDVDNRSFGSFEYTQAAATSSVTLDNFCFDYVALAGTKGNGTYYKQHVENAAKDMTTAEQFIDFTGKTSVTDNAFKSAGGSIYTNNWNTADPRWILMTGAEAMMFGGNVWSDTTATLTSAVTAAEGEKIVVEFDYLFYGADDAGSGDGGRQYIEFSIMNGSTSLIKYKFYNRNSGNGFWFSDNGWTINYLTGELNKWYNIRIEITYSASGSKAQVYIDNVKQGAAQNISADASTISGLKLTGRPASGGTNANSLFDNFVIDNTSTSKTSSYYGQYNAGMLTDAVAYDADATTNVGEIFSNPSYKFVNVNKRPANGTAGNYVLVEDGAVVVGTGSGFNYPSYLKVNLDFADIAVGSKIVAEYDYQFVSSTDYLNTGSAIITNVGFTKTNSQDDTNFNSLDMWTHYYVGSSWVNPDDNVGSNGTVTMTPGTWYKLRVEIDVTETGIVKTYFVDGVQKYQETFTGVTVNSIGGFVMKFTRNVDVQENKYDNFVFAVIPHAAE